MSITVPLFGTMPNELTMTESEFNAAWYAALGNLNPYGSALNALGAQVEQYALDAEAAVAALPNAMWVSGTFADGDVRWSPTDHQDYRNKGSGSRTTDPALDPANWVPRIRTGNGGADTTSSAVDITLTSSSGRLQIIAMTAAGKKVIMPAASTLTKGTPVFVLKNAGTYRVSVHKNGGGFICYLLPGQVIALHCSDTGSSAGVWQASGAPVPDIYTGSNAEVLNAVDSRFVAVAMLGATQAICAFRNESTTYLNAVVLNYGSSSGSPAQVVADACKDISIAAQTGSQATVVYKKSTGETKAVVLDITTSTTFTPGTAKQIDATTGGSGTAVCAQSSTQLLAVYQGSSGTTPKMRVLDIVSSAVNESAEVAADGTNCAATHMRAGKVSSTKAVVAFRNNSGNRVQLRLQTITGSTPAPSGSVLDLSGMPGTSPALQFGLVVMSTTRAVVVTAVDRTYADLMISLVDISGSSPVLLRNKLIRVGANGSLDLDAAKLDANNLYATWTGGGSLGTDGMKIKITDDDQIIAGEIAEKIEEKIEASNNRVACAALDSAHVIEVCRNKDTYLSVKTVEIAA
ncbi:MAG: hypothetical protein HRU77_06425 [Gammaproteobacteria bacterium]|nr:MAG: hypothetical protein HRU77_06425 [Gammaproteobacteria bacterium]